MVDYNKPPYSGGTPEQIINPEWQLQVRLQAMHTLLMRDVTSDMRTAILKNELEADGMIEAVQSRLTDYQELVRDRFDAYGNWMGWNVRKSPGQVSIL